MNDAKTAIQNVNKNICENLDLLGSNSALFSQNVLAQLRNLCDALAVYIYEYDHKTKLRYCYDSIEKGLTYIRSNNRYKFLRDFHDDLLLKSVSHYTDSEDASERLLLKYCELLITIKSFCSKRFSLEILQNINKILPVYDKVAAEYYSQISLKINQSANLSIDNNYNDRYYMKKIKPIFLEQGIIYEVTFSIATDFTSKFDRKIAYTKHKILPNYATKLKVKSTTIPFLDNSIPILIIDDWEISIRDCELKHFADIVDPSHQRISNSNSECRFIFSCLKHLRISLTDLLRDTKLYSQVKNETAKKAKTRNFISVLDRCSKIIQENKDGANIIKYLLFAMNNEIIKKQQDSQNGNRNLSGLFLKSKSIPFDKMPFSMSLSEHNPSFIDICDSIGLKDREEELLARAVRNNIDNRNQLFTPLSEFGDKEKIEELVKKYNEKLWPGHRPSSELVIFKDYISIMEYIASVKNILNRLQLYSQKGIVGFEDSVKNWLNESPLQIDDPQKRSFLISLFKNTRLALIYGAAGSGKTTMINYIAQYFQNKQVLFLAVTKTAVDNLKKRVPNANNAAMTIASYLRKTDIPDTDLLVIDECSTVNNRDMEKILERTNTKLLVLVGDVYQIESIQFGNWFNIARLFIDKSSQLELTNQYRTEEDGLKELWDHVRNNKADILEHLTRNNYTSNLDTSIFERNDEDEIVLCLNYDGIYGINNINSFLQANNPREVYSWGADKFKEGDPVLFNESLRFAPALYNNLKGQIIKIEKYEDYITFEIEVDTSLTELDVSFLDLELLGNTGTGKSLVRFSVDKLKSTDDDNEFASRATVPFQIAYALSIHKAQGLEYNSVKIVISDDLDERITHNIFYTAITRAKKKLKVYWSPSTGNKIISNFALTNYNRDINLLKAFYQKRQENSPQ